MNEVAGDNQSNTFVHAAERTSYQLSFRRSPQTRQFNHDGLWGPGIEDAYDARRQAPGSWDTPEWADQIETTSGWVEQFFVAAVAEAVHEVCEWFRVDGRVLIDPHEAYSLMDVIDRSEAFAHDLYRAHVGAHQIDAQGRHDH